MGDPAHWGLRPLPAERPLAIPALCLVALIGPSGAGKSTFAARQPLWRVHQPVFVVLALESEPVDPRLR